MCRVKNQFFDFAKFVIIDKIHAEFLLNLTQRIVKFACLPQDKTVLELIKQN